MSEHLRTDYDRMVGESYKEYAARMRGQAVAAGKDRDHALRELRRLQAVFERAQEVALRPVGTWSGPEAAHYILGDWTPS